MVKGVSNLLFPEITFTYGGEREREREVRR